MFLNKEIIVNIESEQATCFVFLSGFIFTLLKLSLPSELFNGIYIDNNSILQNCSNRRRCGKSSSNTLSVVRLNK